MTILKKKQIISEMKRRRKVVTVVDQENKKPEKVATTKSKQTNNKKDVKNATATLSGDQLKVVKIILNAQSSDVSSKKCIAELSKMYTSVSIGFGGSEEILK